MGDNVKLDHDGNVAGPIELNNSSVEDHEVEYPYNKVTKYESGHTVEYNNTPNNEYIRIAHKIGTEIIMTKDGDIIIRNSGDADTHTSGNTTIEVGGSMSMNVAGDMNVKVAGDYTVDVRGTMEYKLSDGIQMDVYETAVKIDQIELQDMNEEGVW